MEQLPKLNKWAASIAIINLRIVPVLSTCLCLEILLYILIIHTDFCDGLCALYKISQNHQLFISSITYSSFPSFSEPGNFDDKWFKNVRGERCKFCFYYFKKSNSISFLPFTLLYGKQLGIVIIVCSTLGEIISKYLVSKTILVNAKILFL